MQTLKQIFIFSALSLVVSCAPSKSGSSGSTKATAAGNTGTRFGTPPFQSPSQEDFGEPPDPRGDGSGGGFTGGDSTITPVTVDFGSLRNLYPGMPNTATLAAQDKFFYDEHKTKSGTAIQLSFNVTRSSLESFIRGLGTLPISTGPDATPFASQVNELKFMAFGPYDTFSDTTGVLNCDEKTAPSSKLITKIVQPLTNSTADIVLQDTSMLLSNLEPTKFYFGLFCLSMPIPDTSDKIFFDFKYQIRTVDFTVPVDNQIPDNLSASCTGRRITQPISLTSADPSITSIKAKYFVTNSEPLDWTGARLGVINHGNPLDSIPAETEFAIDLRSGLVSNLVFDIDSSIALPATIFYRVEHYDNSHDFLSILRIDPISLAFFSSKVNGGVVQQGIINGYSALKASEVSDPNSGYSVNSVTCN